MLDNSLLFHFVELFLASAPWLLLGLFIAGLIQVFVPTKMMSQHLGKEGFFTAVKAAFIGAPLPLCSCGVIPAGLGLRKAGASRSATTSFLVATPETGVDSVSLSYALLGPFMAVIRPIAAIVSAIVAGVLVGKDSPTEASAVAGSGGCCGSKQQASSHDEHLHEHLHEHQSAETKSNCCESKNPVKQGLWHKVKQAISYSCNKMIADTFVWLLIGLFFAALIQAYVPQDFLAKWGSGLLAMTVMVLISIPMYICATASTPIAAGLLLSGVSPGAVLVFMMAGPATNIATLGVVAKALGRRAVVAYLTGVIGTALVFGYLTDFLVAEYGFVVQPMIGEEHQMLPDYLVVGCGLLLALLMLRIAVQKSLNHFSTASSH
jgi:uncharacterized membrane protein YraQ (UPF0718 family)